MRYRLVLGFVSIVGAGVVVSSCFDGQNDCALNAAVDCSGTSRGTGGTGGGDAGSIASGGTGGSACATCSVPGDCWSDSPCREATCVKGCCGTTPVNEGMACGAGGAGGSGGGGGAQSHCKGGVCALECVNDSDCSEKTACKTWSCNKATTTCELQEGPTDLLLNEDVPGDCKEPTCVGGMVASQENTADKPAGDGNPCHVSVCDGSMPVVAPQPAGYDCAPSSCGLAGGGPKFEQTTSVCDSSGFCQTPVKASCGLFACDSMTNKCKSSCTADSDCLSSSFCNENNVCELLRFDGMVCSTDNACLHGHCTDGVCCGTSCFGVCQSCNLPGNAGVCKDVPSGIDPDDDCAGPEVCKAGACVVPRGQPCVNNGAACQTLSDVCVDGVCCDTGCAGTCVSCKLSGKQGTCTPVLSGTDPENECTVNGNPAATCNGAGICKLDNGLACTSDGQCFSSNCENTAGGTKMCCATPCPAGTTCVNGNCQ